MKQLKEQYGEQFSQVFRTITTDNGNEFAAFSAFEALDWALRSILHTHIPLGTPFERENQPYLTQVYS